MFGLRSGSAGQMDPSGTALQEIIEELHITSLDESDIEAGLNDLTGLEEESGDGAGTSSASDGGQLDVQDEQPSTDSGISAEVRAALADDDDANGDSIALLESQLRLRTPRSFGPPPPRSLAHSVSDSQPHLARALQQLAQGQAAQAEELAAVRRESRELLRQSARERPPEPPPERPPQRGPPEPPPQRAADAATAIAAASGAFRMQMSDLSVSEAIYQALRARPEDQLSIREWVQMRFFEARSAHRAEADRLRQEVEGLRENAFAAQTRAERAERQLACRNAAVADLSQELERQQQQARQQLEQTTAELRASERAVAELADKGRRFDEVSREGERLRGEVERLREAISAQSTSQQQQGRDLAAASERLLKLEAEQRLAQKDVDSHERRARMLEETLARREDEASELRAKVESLKEKKRELARKAAAEQAGSTQEVHDKVNSEIKRFQEQARADLEAVRGSMTALHEKEVAMLQDRVQAAELRGTELQRRLEDEEHKHQALLISSARVKADLQNEITELTGNLKLRAFEAERATLTHEEVSLSRQHLEAENGQLKQQLELVKKEYYSLEVQHREERAGDRAELASVREQLRCYVDVERELDSAIRACAEGPLAKGKEGIEGTGKPQSVDEALLIGTTLASAPTSAQRRIQQSLILAQELQRRTREASQARSQLGEAQAEVLRLREELEAVRKEVQYSSEPQAYLLEALRRRENEALTLRRELKAREAEVEQCRQQVEHAVAARVQVEEDLKRLLAQRQHLDGLRAVLGSGAGAGETEVPVPRAEQRGRAPSQQPQAAPGAAPSAGARHVPAVPSAGPAWLLRLRMKLDQSCQQSSDP
uniref:Uncharacterized protein n=1 Tax=Alexandrium monilatum TaxID=311494 RepID=A0A7S4VC19_9DINO